MADRSATTIEIGGSIKRNDLQRLVDAAQDDGASVEGWDECYDPGEMLEAVEKAAKEQRTISFFDPEAAWGMMHNLEATATELGLTWCRADDGHYAYAPSHAAWKPGMEKPSECIGTTETGPQVDLNLVWSILFDPGFPVSGFRDRFAVLHDPVPPLTITLVA